MPKRPHPAKAVIVARGDTIKSTAAAIGVNAHTLGRVLNGHVEPWPALRHRLAEHLAAAESELFFADLIAEAVTKAADEAPPLTADQAAALGAAGIPRGGGARGKAA